MPNVVLAIRTDRAVIAGSNQSNNQQNETKKVKGKGKKSQQASSSNSDQNENVIEISFVDKAGLSKELNKIVNDLNDDLLEALVENFLKSLNHQYFELLKSKVESGLISSSIEEGGVSPAKGKNTIKEMQEKLKLFLINTKIFEKGVKTFSDVKTQDSLNKHLIKTIFSDIVNDMVKFIASENMIQFKDESLNVDSRLKIIQKFKEPLKESFNQLHLALSNKPVNEIVDLVEKCAIDFFELSVRKQDINKREKEVLLQQRESTKDSLGKEKDAATILQLTCILLYQQANGVIVNLPGRMVPTLLEALKEDLVEECYSKLIKLQNLIIESLKETEESTDISSQISSMVDEVKEMGLNAKTWIKTK